MMRAVRYHDAGDATVLQRDEVERPEPRQHEILVEIRAASVNPVDAILRETGPGSTPKTTGSDLAGVVHSVGDAVNAYEAGDRVFATGLHTDRVAGGSFAEYAVVPTDLIAPLPDAVSFEEGAAVALVGVTAWRALVQLAALEPGMTAFVHGGNGGVGHVAIGIADAMGAETVATARPEYHTRVESFGANAVYDYSRPDLTDAVRDEIDGADVVVDHIPESYLRFDVEIAGFNGDIVVTADGELKLPDAVVARKRELTFHTMSMSNLATRSALPDIGPILSRIGQLLADDQFAVVIDRILSLDDAEEAHRSLMAESFVGKIVVTP